MNFHHELLIPQQFHVFEKNILYFPKNDYFFSKICFCFFKILKPIWQNITRYKSVWYLCVCPLIIFYNFVYFTYFVTQIKTLTSQAYWIMTLTNCKKSAFINLLQYWTLDIWWHEMMNFKNLDNYFVT